jgi:hypothetical protein
MSQKGNPGAQGVADSSAGGKFTTQAATFPKFVASSGSHMMRSSAYS